MRGDDQENDYDERNCCGYEDHGGRAHEDLVLAYAAYPPGSRLLWQAGPRNQ
jgi:hypothetical protein